MIVAMMLVAAVAGGNAPSRNVTAAEQRATKTHFNLVLIDAPSARWRWLKVARGSLVCGYLNGKNRFGGYTGWTPFTYDLKTKEGAIFTGKLDAAYGFGKPCLGIEPPPLILN